jgi:hypothetical protein
MQIHILREFQGLGHFDVNITIDKEYILGGTGYLQNPNEIDLSRSGVVVAWPKKSKNTTWHFV